MKRRWWWIAAAVVFAAAVTFAIVRAMDDRRGVLLITLDAVRADHLSCYGYDRQTTSFIDSLAARGTVFENAIAASSNTPVTHAAILTGLYPPHNGLRFIHGFEAHRLREDVPTAAALFGQAGFKTAAFVSAFPLDAKRYGLNRGFSVYDDDLLKNEKTAITPDGFVMVKENQRSGRETLDRFVGWLKRERPRRFFVWVHLFDAHDAIVLPPEEFLNRFPARRREKRRHTLYDAEIAYQDHLLKTLFDELKPLFPLRKLQVAILSDHGDGLGDHGYERHTGRIYQEQLRVPLILWGAGFARGVRVAPEVRTVDLLPTLLESNGLPIPQGLDGASLTPVIDGREDGRVCYAEALSPMSAGERPLFAVIKQGRKIIYSPKPESFEFFDLRKDPGELQNLHGMPEHRVEFDALFAELRRFSLSIDFDREKELSPEEQEHLRSLGYL